MCFRSFCRFSPGRRATVEVVVGVIDGTGAWPSSTANCPRDSPLERTDHTAPPSGEKGMRRAILHRYIPTPPEKKTLHMEALLISGRSFLQQCFPKLASLIGGPNVCQKRKRNETPSSVRDFVRTTESHSNTNSDRNWHVSSQS